MIELEILELGKPVKHYKKGRKCRKCKTPLSQYNPHSYCWICVAKYTDRKNLPYALYENKSSKERLKDDKPTKKR